MDNKKLGAVFLVISIVLAVILIQLMNSLNVEAQELGCFQNAGCVKIQSTLSITHFAFGFIGFILALGFYLLFFTKGEEAIVKQLQETKEKQLAEDRFTLIVKGLDGYEKKVLTAVKEQPAITQNTLRIRTNMSKAKLSYVLQDLEKKDLIRKERKGKTHALYLKEEF